MAVVVLCLLGVPSVAGEPGTFARAEIEMAPEIFHAALYTETHEGEDAQDLRAYIDNEHGDGDGTVDADEVTAFVEGTTADLNAQLSSPFASGLTDKIRVNDRPPLQVRVVGMEMSDNTTGDVSDDTTIVRDVFADLTFAATSRDRANISFAQDFRQAFFTMKWGHAVFSAQGPWTIDGATIEPDGTENPYWTGDGFEVAYGDMGDFSSGFDPLSFQLENETDEAPGKDKKKSPAPALPLLAAALAVAGHVLRRRR